MTQVDEPGARFDGESKLPPEPHVVFVVKLTPRTLVVGVLRAGAIWLLLLGAAMAFAYDPMLRAAWSGTSGSDAWLGASAWLAVAAAVAIGFPRTSVAGATMATLLGVAPIVFAGREPVLYVPTLGATLAWLVVRLHGRNDRAHAPALRGAPLTPHEHL